MERIMEWKKIGKYIILYKIPVFLETNCKWLSAFQILL